MGDLLFRSSQGSGRGLAFGDAPIALLDHFMGQGGVTAWRSPGIPKKNSDPPKNAIVVVVVVMLVVIVKVAVVVVIVVLVVVV